MLMLIRFHLEVRVFILWHDFSALRADLRQQSICHTFCFSHFYALIDAGAPDQRS